MVNKEDVLKENIDSPNSKTKKIGTNENTTTQISQKVDEKIVPQYANTLKDYQEHTIQSIKDMTYNYIEFQKNMTSSFQSGYLQFLDHSFRTYWNNFMIPERMTEVLNKLNDNNNNTTLNNIQTTNNVFIDSISALNKISDFMNKYSKDFSQIYYNYIQSLERSTSSH